MNEISTDAPEWSRRKLLKISPEALVFLLIDGNKFRISKGLPKDAKIHHSGFDYHTGLHWFSVYSESYPPVPIGACSEVLEPLTIQRTTVVQDCNGGDVAEVVHNEEELK